MKKIGFIGLGNVGNKLASSILRNQLPLIVFDSDSSVASSLIKNGAQWANSVAELTKQADIIITCLPSPPISAEVMEGKNGVLENFSPQKIWLEMSTTDAKEVQRIGALVEAAEGFAMDCPVSGGCHRAATGNISIFAGGSRNAFEQVFYILNKMGRRILHTGPLGSASVLKVITNYLATANLVSVCEALVTAKSAGMDLNTAFEAIRISSGNSFVHETESQVILNGSRDINFTMDLVLKDISLFQKIADDSGVELELSPLLIKIFKDGQNRYGDREWSSNIIRRLEDNLNTKILAPGFPEQMLDDEEESEGYEIIPKGKS